MRHAFGLQISDLETIPSVFEQELTTEEAEKVVGGCNSSTYWRCPNTTYTAIGPLKKNIVPGPDLLDLGDTDVAINLSEIQVLANQY